MAYTIISQPTYKFEPVFNYLNFKVQSSQSNQAKYQFLADIYIDGVFITRLKNAPAPDGYGYFNIARIVENYVTTNTTSLLSWASNPGRRCIGSYADSVIVKFGERYGADTPTDYPDLATSNTFHPFNSALNYFDRANYVGTNYVITGATSKKFLTNAPRTISITREQNFWLTFLRDDLNVESFVIKGYVDSILTYTWYIDYNINGLDDGGRMVRIPSSPNLWHQINASFVTGDDWNDVTDSNINYYEISLATTSPIAIASETFTIEFKSDVCRYTPKEIVFLNRLGGIESFVFQLASSEKMSINRTTYTNANPISQLNYSASDRNQFTFGVASEQQFSALSNWITEAESEWLKELLTSPICFVNENGVLIPINILTTDYDVFNKTNRKLFNVKIDYKYTITNDIQRS